MGGALYFLVAKQTYGQPALWLSWLQPGLEKVCPCKSRRQGEVSACLPIVAGARSVAVGNVHVLVLDLNSAADSDE